MAAELGAERDIVLPADAAESLMESTEVDNPVADAVTAAMQTDENMNNGLIQGSDAAEEPADNEDEDMDDLFGDEDGDAQAGRAKKRRLDDEELDSGDDIDRDDRTVEDEQPATPEPEQEEVAIAEIELTRHATIKGTDGELYLLHNPIYTGIEPKAFAPRSFAPPTTNHHSSLAPSANFSAAQTAATTLRWRRAPSDSTKLQSNSRIIRWSDGSLTLQVGSAPLEQYELPATSLAQPQLNPKKPTPVSRLPKKGVVPRANPKANSHTHLVSVHEDSGFGRVTNHVTASLTVRSTKTAGDEQADDALLRLQEKMGATIAAKRGVAAGRLAVHNAAEDPEEGRKRAEKAEKEKARALKQKQARIEREEQRREGMLGRAAPYGRSGGGGLTVGGLEDDELGGGRGALRKPRGPAKKKARKSAYDDDEEDLKRGRTKEDEYDEEDDFIAPEDDDDEEEGGEGAEEEEEEEEFADEDPDAEGEAEDEPVQSVEKTEEDVAAARSRRRQVVDEDDED